MADIVVTIGEFSRLSLLSRKALRIYDEMGILKPIAVDPLSGYRYYAPIQVIESERIRALRTLGMSLKEIEIFLNEKDSEELDRKLKDFRDKLESNIAGMRRNMDLLDHLTKEREAFFLNYKVMLKDVESQWIISTRITTSIDAIGSDMKREYEDLCNYMISRDIPISVTGMSLYHCEEFNPNKMEVEVAMTLEHEYEVSGKFICRELPACTMASTLHLGPYEGIQAAYGAVYNWVGENGYEKSGPDREIYLNCPEVVDKLEDLRTEIALPVVKK